MSWYIVGIISDFINWIIIDFPSFVFNIVRIKFGILTVGEIKIREFIRDEHSMLRQNDLKNIKS